MESYTIDLVGIGSRIIDTRSYTIDLVGIDSRIIDMESYTIDLSGIDSRSVEISPHFSSSNTLYMEHHTEKQLVPFLNL